MTPRERLFALEQFGIKLGLDNIHTLLDALNHPERAYPTVHIAGTNGKGSVTAMVERGLRAAGHRTGRYTSPHLTDIEERIAIDGRPVDAATFDAVTGEVLALVDRLLADRALEALPTFFEVTTAVAFEVFRRTQVSGAVIEVGLGGRFDATNVLTPAVSAITSIALDHERHLGSSIAQIAFEKAGIIKPGVPVVAGLMPPEACDVVARTAARLEAPLIWARPEEAGVPVDLGLAGAHQRENAAIAAAVLRLTTPMGRLVTNDHIISGLTDVNWPARLEWLRLPAGDVLLDAAHNPAGAAALADYVVAATGPLPLVCGVMKDKDVAAIVRALSPAASRYVATTALSPRALSAGELADRIREVVPAADVAAVGDPETAVIQTLHEDGYAVVAGSIFLVGPVRAHLCARGATRVRYPVKTGTFFLN